MLSSDGEAEHSLTVSLSLPQAEGTGVVLAGL